MKYIVIAHKREARPIFSAFTCKKTRFNGLDIYSNDYFKLIFCGNGVKNAQIKTALFLEQIDITQEDTLINIGICGAPKWYEKHQFIEVGKLSYHHKEVILDENRDDTLCSVDTIADSGCKTLVDMEAFGIYEAAKSHFLTTQMHFYKMVSDYCERTSLSQEAIQACIDANSKNIQGVLT